MKNVYVEPEIHVIEFDPADVILTSGCEYEGPQVSAPDQESNL